MEQSTNYNFNLPSKNDETSADIDLISDNFRTVDDVVKQVQDDVSKIPTNLVNGSAEGSLRGVNTWSSEDDEADYKIGENAVTLGIATRAKGRCSFAEGYHTTANGYAQHVKGRYNIPDYDNKYADIVGNGYYKTIFDNKLSNAHTLDWDGNAWFAGDVYVGGTSQDDESATKLSGVALDVAEVKEKLKNHTAFSILVSDPNSKTYIKLGKFTGDGIGGRAIFTINGKVGWNNKNDGGLKILTLSSNDSRDTTSTDIFTGGSFFDFGHSDNDGTSIIEDTPDIQVAIVRPSEYTVKEVDVYLKFTPTKYTSYLVTVDYSGTCKWETDVKPVNATDPDPMETALSSYIVPKKRFGGVEEGATKTIVDTALSTTSTNPVQNKVVTEKIKNHASFLARRVTANTVYINLGKFTGDNGGGKAIITISGNPYWGGKGDGGFRVLTLSSNSYSDISSTDIHTGASLYDFGQSNYTGTEIVDDQYNIQVALVRPNGYSVAEVDVYLKFNNYQYNSYLVTVDYSDGCSWVTSTEKVTTSDPDPMENALSAFIVPKRQIADLTKLKTKADVETGNCTLAVSNGTVSNATYSVVGNMVTLNFNIAPTGAGNVVVSGLPFAATKNQSGVASSTATFNITANQTSVSINSSNGNAEYCTVTYLK